MKKASSSLVLLDVNVLLPLAWPNHQFHSFAIAFLDNWRGLWATCAITQLGFIRLSSNPAAVGTAVIPAEARRLLEVMTKDRGHRYLDVLPPPAEPGLGRLFDQVLGHAQTTDAYLIALAESVDAQFATFDTRLSPLSKRVKVLGPS
jgi:toxin-antitoxin system PIN domain toxin